MMNAPHLLRIHQTLENRLSSLLLKAKVAIFHGECKEIIDVSKTSGASHGLRTMISGQSSPCAPFLAFCSLLLLLLLPLKLKAPAIGDQIFAW
jgi:hypothetical protein